MKNIYYLILVLLTLFSASTEAQTQPTCVKVKITGFRVNTGKLYVSIYQNQESFLKIGKQTATNVVQVNAKDTAIETCFSGLESGWYAIALYHDEDDNKKMNSGLFGIPLEPYGLSNNFRPRFSYPKFSQCSFYVQGNSEKDMAIALITPIF